MKKKKKNPENAVLKPMRHVSRMLTRAIDSFIVYFFLILAQFRLRDFDPTHSIRCYHGTRSHAVPVSVVALVGCVIKIEIEIYYFSDGNRNRYCANVILHLMPQHWL